MIVITGAAGFIGSVVVGYLNRQGIDDIICVDDMIKPDQFKNLIGKKFHKLYSTNDPVEEPVHTVIHLGANSDTLEKDWSSIYRSNVRSTRYWYDFCQKHDCKFVFASSAAVYGNGSGPMNQYAFSKILSEQEMSTGVVLRLFNVYGPNEFHKDRMASTVYHWHQQSIKGKSIKIFKNSENYKRDFIYVEDVAKITDHFIKNYQPGIYDVGTGISNSFDVLADIFCENFHGTEKIYIDMPPDLSAQYQTYSCANTENLIKTGFDISGLCDLRDGVGKYRTFLDHGTYY